MTFWVSPGGAASGPDCLGVQTRRGYRSASTHDMSHDPVLGLWCTYEIQVLYPRGSVHTILEAGKSVPKHCFISTQTRIYHIEEDLSCGTSTVWKWIYQASCPRINDLFYRRCVLPERLTFSNSRSVIFGRPGLSQNEKWS